MSPATFESRPENISRGARPGAAASTTMSSTSAGRGTDRRHGEIAILLPFGSLAGAQPRDAEPGMIGELHDELLPHHARGAKDADVYSAGNH